MSTGRQPEPSLDFEHYYPPPPRMRSDDAEDAQDAVYAALLDANARYLAELKQRPALGVDCPLERFRADSARGF